MIFVTVGEQLPFDRLVRAVDQWAARNNQEVFAQVGRSVYRPYNIQYSDFIGQDEFRRRLQEAELIVGHAGMGTIISAIEMGKRVIVMPRKADLGEHRNDHQLATAKKFFELGYIDVAIDENELIEKLLKFSINADAIFKKEKIKPSMLLAKTIRDFIFKI